MSRLRYYTNGWDLIPTKCWILTFFPLGRCTKCRMAPFLLHLSGLIITEQIYEPRHDKMCLRAFPSRPDTNRPAQPQKLASLEISAIEARDILSKQRTTKALIRLRGWSAPLLFAYDIRHIFSRPGSYKINPSVLQGYARLFDTAFKWAGRSCENVIMPYANKKGAVWSWSAPLLFAV